MANEAIPRNGEDLIPGKFGDHRNLLILSTAIAHVKAARRAVEERIDPVLQPSVNVRIDDNIKLTTGVEGGLLDVSYYSRASEDRFRVRIYDEGSELRYIPYAPETSDSDGRLQVYTPQQLLDMEGNPEQKDLVGAYSRFAEYAFDHFVELDRRHRSFEREHTT
jgi:hypothetical protein